jgi:hypothetical protein
VVDEEGLGGRRRSCIGRAIKYDENKYDENKIPAST